MESTFQDWIGRQITRTDLVTRRLSDEFASALAPHLFIPANPDEQSPGFHWGLAPATPRGDETGADGAERKGLFLPPISLPRRMWAGGRIESLRPLRLGQTVTRTSTIADIVPKTGRGGQLCIVSITHDITDADGLLVRERQDLVFRDGLPPRDQAPPEASVPEPGDRVVDATALLLFRFSAFTFNGHRIHYDAAHAAEEGYPGLVVHGPLQAALMLNHIAHLRGSVPAIFDYRCVAPLFAGTAFRVRGSSDRVRIIRHDGVTTAEGEARAPAP